MGLRTRAILAASGFFLAVFAVATAIAFARSAEEPGGEALLPDLRTLPPEDLRVEEDGDEVEEIDEK